MQIKHYIYILAAIALTACSTSSDDDIIAGGDTTDSGVTDVQYPITFSSNVEQSQTATRASSSAASDSISQMTVYGFKFGGNGSTGTTPQLVMPGYVMTYSSSSANTSSTNGYGWEYVNSTANQTILYWDLSTDKYGYRFYAWAHNKTYTGDLYTVTASPSLSPSTMTDAEIREAGTTFTSGENPTATLSFTADVTKQSLTPFYSHLNYVSLADANDEGSTTTPDVVTMELVKPFARVRIMLQDQNATYSSDVAVVETGQEANDTTTLQYVSAMSFRPTDEVDIPTAGTVTVSYPCYIELNSKKNVSNTDETVTVSITDRALEEMTIPYQHEYDETEGTPRFFRDLEGYEAKKWYDVLACGEQGTYTFSIIYKGTERSVIIPSVYMNWLPYYEYTYVFKVTDTAAEFVPELYDYTRYQYGVVEDVEW